MRGRPLHHVALTSRDPEVSRRCSCEGWGLEPIDDMPGGEQAFTVAPCATPTAR